MTQPLRALLVEDSADDVELLVRELTRAGFDPAWLRVESRDGAAAALASQAWDVVLCDYSVPGFGLAGMLELLRETEKDIPCVVVSGAIPKEEAVAAMRHGAADYIFKSDLARLGPCIERELREAESRRSRRAAVEQLVLLREAIESSNDVVLVLESTPEDPLTARIIYANSALERITGYSPEEVVGKSPRFFVGPNTDKAVVEAVDKALLSRQPVRAELINYRKDGGEVWVELSAHPISGNEEGTTRWVSVRRDVTKRKVAEQAAHESTARLKHIVEQMPAMVWTTDADLIFTSSKGAGLADLRLVPDQVCGMSLYEYFQTDDPEFGPIAAHYRALAGEPTSYEMEWAGRAYQSHVELLRGADGQTIGVIGIALDVTGQRQAEAALRAGEEQLSYLAQHDALTKLPNRALLEDRLGQAIAHAQRTGRSAAVLFLDLNRFKNINETLGHATGDALLRAVADRLVATFRGGDTVARAGGDEFILALADMGQPEDAVLASRKLTDALEEPFHVAERDFFVTGSIGVSVYPQDGEDSDTLIRNAETAMYQAKEYGANAFRMFTPAMHATATKRLLLENDFRKALERDEFVLLYQPIVNLSSGRIVGAEALVRWKHPVLGLLPPDDFIDLAEEIGLIEPLGEHVLRAACEQSRRWQRSSVGPLRVSVNLSPRQFAISGLAKVVQGIIRECNLEPASLELEITESLVTRDIESALRTLRELHQMGVRLTLDDFGTGYSSLGLLKNFPIDALKIDRSFVQQISVDPFDKAIAETIVTLGHSLQLNVIAEGVETRAQLILLRHIGCDEMQGFYFSRAIPPEDFDALLQKRLM